MNIPIAKNDQFKGHVAVKVKPNQKQQVAAVVFDLRETASNLGCYSLSAPEICTPLRVMVIKDGDEYIPLINPEVIEVSEETQVNLEPSLNADESGRYFVASVERPERIIFSSSNIKGGKVFQEASGRMAAMILQGIDNMNGRTFLSDVEYDCYMPDWQHIRIIHGVIEARSKEECDKIIAEELAASSKGKIMIKTDYAIQKI